MNTASKVDELIQKWIKETDSKAEIAVNIAEACIGWSYVFGARGEYCTPANRRKRDWEGHPTIKSKCKNFDGDGSCSGCKWYPSGGKTRCFDCRGFTYWVLKQVDIIINGAGATSQYNNDDNWSEKGKIADMPNVVCCVFKQSGKTMEHTGLHIGNGQIIHCSNGVQTGKTTDNGWTHYAIPNGMDGKIDPDRKPTLRRGDKGEYVTLLQTQLDRKGYDIGKSGIDGIFGKATEAAVKKFQTDNGLTADGIVGKKTWEALGEVTPTKLYTVHIPFMTETQAQALIDRYPGAYKTVEGGENNA